MPNSAQVMVLGTYHFEDPGLDAVQTKPADVLTPERQTEVWEVIDALSRFAPTKVAVEAPFASTEGLEKLYTAYRQGVYELGRNEIQQLGFRIAACFDHPRVYCIDHPGDFPVGPVMEYARQRDPQFAQNFEETVSELETEAEELHRRATIREILRQTNDPAQIARVHGIYVEFAAVGAGDNYVGADLLSAWYDRNIRIFANMLRITEKDNRVLVIIGAGHAAILRELVLGTAGLELVDPLDFL